MVVSNPYEHAFDGVLPTAGKEVGWLKSWCADWARRFTGREQAIDQILADKSDLERRGMVIAMIWLCGEHASSDPYSSAQSEAGFFGYQDSAATVLRALGRLRLSWTPEEARALAAYASQREARRMMANLDFYTIASRALEQLNDEDLRASAKELVFLRRAANSTRGLDGEPERRAAVQRLKRLVWRAQAGSREKIPDYALEWRDGFRKAARPAVLAVAEEPDAALALEVLGLFGTAREPTRRWRSLIEEVGPQRLVPVARAVIETVHDLDDDPEVFNEATNNPMFLDAESQILVKAAAWVIVAELADPDLELLREVAIKCAERQSGPGPRLQRAPGVATSIVAALGSLSDTPASDSARKALEEVSDVISSKPVRNAVGEQLQSFPTRRTATGPALGGGRA